jgi:hypothetical protein
MICLPCSGFPRWFLASQDGRQPIEVTSGIQTGSVADSTHHSLAS